MALRIEPPTDMDIIAAGLTGGWDDMDILCVTRTG
jgi:hypothetical protein